MTAATNNYGNTKVVTLIKELSLKIIGRDIFKREIGIVDGHDSSSYFWIKPARVIDCEDTADLDSVAVMRSVEISIKEGDVDQYLTPFLYEYFDEELEANKNRNDVSGFERYLEHNFFTFDQMSHILKDIADTVEALVSGKETEYTEKLKIKRGIETYRLLEVAGAENTFELAWQCARPNAIITVVALYDKAQTLPLADMYGKNLTLKTGGVDGCDCEETLKLIAEGKLDTEPLITHTYPLAKIDEAYELFGNKRDGVIKVAVEC